VNLRDGAKGVVFFVAACVTAPLWLLSWLEKRVTKSEALFALGAQLCAIVPGHPGLWIRAAYYRATLDDCSWRTHIGFGSLFTHRGAHVADRVSTGAWCVLGHVRLGANARLASRVSIPSGKRQHLDESGALSTGTRFDNVAIGEGCWIGEGAIVLADVGARSIVGAGAVVTRAQPGGMLISGNPATIVRELPAGDTA
jgi:acetyltransferase-like isoleucine patch superfamily enzyme